MSAVVRAYTTDDLYLPRPFVLQTTHHDTQMTLVEVRQLAGYLTQMADGLEAEVGRTHAFTMPVMQGLEP